MSTPSITVDRILAAIPATTRGQPTQLSTDAKGLRIAYAVSAIASDLIETFPPKKAIYILTNNLVNL